MLDVREEMADTEVAIQDTRDQLLDSLVSFNEDEKETAMPGEMPDTEFGDDIGLQLPSVRAPVLTGVKYFFQLMLLSHLDYRLMT